MRLTVNKANAYIKEAETLTSGRAGLEMFFDFSAEWNGLSKTAVFTANNVTKYVFLSEDKCTVPYEILTTAGVNVICGVYGSNGDDIIIPTVYCSLGMVENGTSISGQESGAITQSLYNQVAALLSEAEDELDYIKEISITQVDTDNSDANNVGTASVSLSYEWIDDDDHSQGKKAIFKFSNLKGVQGSQGNRGEPGYTPQKGIDYTDGEDGADGADGVSPTISTEEIPNGVEVTVTDVSHTETFEIHNGSDGDDGFSPVVSTSTISGGNRISITDKTHTENFDVLNGTDGTDGVDGDDGFDPVIEVEDIDGGHRVKITDATHTEEFDVMNGRDGQGSGDMLASVYDPQGKAKQVAFADELPIPDWNENDPTSPNYIANRTHYSEFTDATVTASGSGSKEGNLYVTDVYILNDSSEPIPNTKASAVVTVDGIATEYTNLTLSTYYSGTHRYIANMTIEEWQQQFETGVITNPIIILFSEEKDYDEKLISLFGYFYVSETAFDHIAVTVNYKGGMYHTISPNYLPKATDNELGIINDAPPIDEYAEDEDNIYVRAGNEWISLYEAGVMLKSVYDPWKEEKDIFKLLDDKMEYYILDFDGTKFTRNGTTVPFNKIKLACLDEVNFVYAQYNNRLYIPQYVSNNNIFFQTTYIDSDVPQIHRISINNSDQVSQYSYNLAKDTDVPTKTSDLTNDSGYITRADYSNDSTAGTVKVNTSYGTMVEGAGDLTARVLTAEEYESFNNKGFISKGTLDAVLNELPVVRRYGFKRKKSESNPSARIEYLYDAVKMTPAYMDFTNGVFVWGDWNEFVNEIARPVMLKLDGTVDYELDHNDQTKKIDGTESDITNTAYNGNAMVEFSNFKWVKRYEDETYEYVIFSNKKFDDGYHAYAHTGEDGQVNDAFYYGMYTSQKIGTALRSFGVNDSSSSQNAEAEITQSKANGSGYNIHDHMKLSYILDLLVLIGKSDNLQATYGEGNSSSSGKIANGTLKDKGAFFGYNTKASAVKVLWIENLWGNIWQRMHGLICDRGTYKTKAHAPFCDTPVSAANYSTYRNTGITAPASGFVKDAYNTDLDACLPKTTGGSASTYFCDRFSVKTSNVYFAIVGGYAFNGSECGRCVNLETAASASSVNLTSRLAYTP